MLQEGRRVLALEGLALDPVEIDLHLVGDAAMGQGLDERLIGVLEPGIFAHDGDGDLAFGIAHPVLDLVPARQHRRRRRLDVEGVQHLLVESLGVVGGRHGIDVVHIPRLDHRAFPHIAEQRELAPLLARDLAICAAEQDVRLDADGAQLLHRMLGRLGLHLAGGGDEGQQRQVDEDGVAAGQLVLQLAGGLEEGQAFDVAHRAADLHQDEVETLVALQDEVLDGVGDVGDHLDGGAKIVAAPFLGEDVLVDPARGDVVLPGAGMAGEALVMAEVEVGLRPVVGDEHLAVLIRAHGARINVQIGVELAQAHGIAASLEKCAERRGGESLAKGGHDAAGDEDVARHGPRPYLVRTRFGEDEAASGFPSPVENVTRDPRHGRSAP